MGLIIVVYVQPGRRTSEKTPQVELKQLLLNEFIDGEAILGAAITDQNGVAIVHHIPNTMTVKSFRNVVSLLEFAQHAARISDDLVGQYQYLVVRYANFKVAFFEIKNKGWLIIFVNPMWHVENLLVKIRQFMVKISRML